MKVFPSASLLELGAADVVGVDLVVDVLAVVHVEARVQERTVAQVLVSVRLQGKDGSLYNIIVA